MVQLHSQMLKFVHTFKESKHFLKLTEHKKASAVNVAANGKITKKFDDPNGKVMNSIPNESLKKN